MTSIREILRLKGSLNLSGRDIARSLNISRTAVSECLRRAAAANISWPIPGDLDDDALTALLYPVVSNSVRPQPDCEYIHKELKKKGVTLSLLWAEYKRDNPDGYQQTSFNMMYRNWLQKSNLVMRQEHLAGHKVFSDFSGGWLPITDPDTGEVKQARLFVSALGASNFTYAEPFFSESAEAWCLGQAHAFEYFGGTPEIVVPDNPRAVVTKACRYEPDLNPDFLVLAQHFDVAVVPARVRKPKDKAIVEAAVGLATRWIIARLRNHTFFSLTEAASAVRSLVDDLNDRSFKKLKATRRSLFEEIEKSALKPLPRNKYEYVHVQYATVRSDYHIELDKCYYSVPFQLVRERVELRIAQRTIEIFFNGRRVASHAKCERANQTRRIDEHMPKSHRAYKDWTPQRVIDWGKTVGQSTALFVERLMSSKKYPELAYRSSFGVLRLAKEYGNSRLEGACQRAIAINSYSYKTVKIILQNNMDCSPLPHSETPLQLQIIHNNIRGAAYFASSNRENTDANSSNARKSQESQAVRNGEGS